MGTSREEFNMLTCKLPSYAQLSFKGCCFLCFYCFSSYGIDTASCARECDCMSHTYEPVCGEDGLTYFSPCRAGCYNATATSNNKVSSVIQLLLSISMLS